MQYWKGKLKVSQQQLIVEKIPKGQKEVGEPYFFLLSSPWSIWLMIFMYVYEQL